jgi:hypothetical protein
MSHWKTVVLGAALAALMLGPLGVPVAAAAPARLAIVQGIPGRSVDICFDATEVRSGLKYGKVMLKSQAQGPLSIRVFARDARVCRGTLLMSTGVNLAAGSDFTIVITKREPRWVVFSNAGLGRVPARLFDVALAWRHAADLGPVEMRIVEGPLKPIEPAADPEPWVKGDEHTRTDILSYPTYAYVTVATPVGSQEPVAGPVTTLVKADRRYEFVLVGTRPANARIVVLVRSIA